ncbi:VWA domain-containing protein [Dasania sp. GY-MA-18]|uniref:VWA domain-containing protein n=1 Tax=Dasania phycosphaerae TaxID=2950436 RepID=A0A9J6RMU4_9GAMM|nr:MULTISPECIES: VWA domain-containing protein [Dasania]MCR8922878.1 VWA domain-containing protein [Dasania sp. GY-MA-18]MCZ0865309.1 VWA domain-containing protein [Dasania phycosphaerae]MCZ0869034.1 VWA domain-containing protein [Dasania phycosphaerae]
MLEFQLPWVFYCLPLPLLAYLLLPRAKQQQTAVRVPFYHSLEVMQQQHSHKSQQRPLQLTGLVLCWLLLVTAAAQPTWIGDPIHLPTEGRDLMLAVDLSESMRMEDMQAGDELVNRLVAVKAVINDFVDRRAGDRIGLILFGSQAYIQAPLTFDRETVKRFMRESQIGFAGPATAIGDAIGLAVKRLRKRPGDKHVLILLTDGANTAGEVQPLAAAKFAAQHNITIYTVGVGADQLTTPGFFGSSFGARTINPSKDLDEDTLQKIAALTGGKYFRAKNPKELLEIYRLVDELEPTEADAKTFRPSLSLFYWPLAVAVIISLITALLKLPRPAWLANKSATEGES